MLLFKGIAVDFYVLSKIFEGFFLFICLFVRFLFLFTHRILCYICDCELYVNENIF